MKTRRTALTVFFLLLSLFLASRPLVEAQALCTALPARIYLPGITASHPTLPMTISIIQPYATTNMVSNPSAETATTNYTAVGGSLARSTTQQKRGAYSIAVTPTATTTDGAYYGTVSLVNGTTYTFSLDVWGVVGIPYRIYVGSTAAAVLGTPTTFTGTGTWQRVEVSYTETSSTTRRLYMVKNSSASTGVFYVDGLQLEALSFSTTYCDGDQTGCQWVASSHASVSTRSSQVRAGGKKINLNTLSAYLVSQQGTGMPPVTNQTTSYASIDGSFLNKQSVKERSLTIALSTSGDGVQAWHANRQALIDLVKPNLTYPQQPFVLVYDDGGKEMRLSCWYDGGLEMADGKQDIETVAIKCLATDPMWTTDGNDGVGLAVQQTIATPNYVLYRTSAGVWSAMGTGLNGQMNTALRGSDGAIYVGGGFSSAGGVSNTNGIAKWDGTNWSALGTGLTGTAVYALTLGPDGSLYAGYSGTMGGVANTNGIAKWNGTAWSALGTGTNVGANVRAIAFAPDGSMYVGGTFSSMTAVANTAQIAKWNGSAWSALGTGGVNTGDYVGAILVAPDSSVYVGGTYTNIMGGVADTQGIAKWNGTAWSSLSTVVPRPIVYSIVQGLDGTIYAAGQFTTMNSVTNTIGIAKWNGTAWSSLGTGIGSGVVWQMALGSNGFLYVFGSFSTVGGITPPDRSAIWNGSMWTYLDFDGPGTDNFSVAVSPFNELYVGLGTSGAAITAAVTVASNTGSAKAYPKVVITGPSSGTSRLYQMINYTTNKPIYFNYIISTGETLTFDFTPGHVSFTSSFRGNIMNSILPGSIMSDFSLIPGNNNISFYAASSTVTANMTWAERCFSVDSSGT